MQKTKECEYEATEFKEKDGERRGRRTASLGLSGLPTTSQALRIEYLATRKQNSCDIITRSPKNPKETPLFFEAGSLHWEICS